jgi:tetratricopeptide (TPR) repeat protein
MEQRRDKFYVLLITAGIILSTLFVYWQVGGHQFTNFDDDKYIVSNEHLNKGLSGEGIRWAFTEYHAHNWHPVTWISHMVDCELFGLDPAGHLLVNVFFHIVNALLIFFVFKAMTGNVFASGFVAAAFALHPMHVESVAWASERKDVLSTLFWLLTMWAYTGYSRNGDFRWYLLSLLFFAVGLFAKQMLVTVPIVLLLLDYWPLRRFESPGTVFKPITFRRSVLEKIPFLFLSFVAAGIVYVVQLRTGTVKTFGEYPLCWRLCNAVLAYAGYISKMLWPTQLSIFYSHPRGDIPILKLVLLNLILCFATVFSICNIRKRPYIFFGWFWYLVTLLPVIGIIQVGWQSMADRYSYMPLTGLFVIVAFGCIEIFRGLRYRRLILLLCSVVVLVSLSVLSFFQVRHWQNSITLYRHCAEVTKDNDWAYLNLGAAYMLEQDYEQAITNFEKALSIEPGLIEAHYNLALVFSSQGRLDKAAEKYKNILEINPDNVFIRKELAFALLKTGKADEAVLHFVEVLRAKPDFAGTYSDAGVLLTQQGKINEAIKLYEQGLQIKADWPVVMNNLAWILATNPDAQLRKPARAVELAERACELTNYADAGFLDTLAAAYASAGQFGKAVSTIEKSLNKARIAGQEKLAKQLEKRLALYRTSEPYIEDLAKNIKDEKD